LLGNVIDFKGSFKKATQELSKKGLKVLYSLKNRFMNFSSIPVNQNLSSSDNVSQTEPLCSDLDIALLIEK
jgi:hypothetical protein